ncbi:MAG: hypothetical protein C4344_07130, partial [Acidimicrobiia bacterium]
RNRQAFLDGYLPGAEAAGLLAGDAGAWTTLLGALELEKAAYEVAYERAHRPEWIRIPWEGLRRLLAL